MFVPRVFVCAGPGLLFFIPCRHVLLFGKFIFFFFTTFLFVISTYSGAAHHYRMDGYWVEKLIPFFLLWRIIISRLDEREANIVAAKLIGGMRRRRDNRPNNSKLCWDDGARNGTVRAGGCWMMGCVSLCYSTKSPRLTKQTQVACVCESVSADLFLPPPLLLSNRN